LNDVEREARLRVSRLTGVKLQPERYNTALHICKRFVGRNEKVLSIQACA
jgi:hypothetical protein